MKRNLFLLFILVVISSVNTLAQDVKCHYWFRAAHAMNWSDELVDDYEGVQRVTIKRYDVMDHFGEVVKDGDPYVAVFDFDDNGHLVKNSSYLNGTLAYVVVYKYDTEGRLVERGGYDENCYLDEKCIYGYDSAGRLLEKRWFDSEGAPGWRGRHLYEYDSAGNVAGVEHYDYDGVLYGTNRYAYDSEGKQIENVGYELDGSLSYKQTYKYDSEGFLIEEVCYNYDGTISEKMVYSYDSVGNMVEMVWNNRGVIETHRRKYDSRGNEVEILAYKTEGLIPFCLIEFEIVYSH